MKKILLLILFFTCNTGFLLAQDSVRIYGQVTDFNSQPLDGVLVSIKDNQFNDIYSTTTDSVGNYSMKVPKGNYFCLYAVRPDEYFTSKLEYWTWNVPAHKDLNINPQYGDMEVYGINAFKPQVTPHETYMIYFRPMSLKKARFVANLEERAAVEKEATQNHDTIDIAPQTIHPDELSVQINGGSAKVVSINKVLEYARGGHLYGYTIQVLKPEGQPEGLPEDERVEGYDKISITLHSKETNEIGKSESFCRKNSYRN